MATRTECKYSVFDIAEYFIFNAAKDDQELLSNLKLQKLVYYAQGLHLAIYNKSLFDEKIIAWQYGPVVPELYHKYKSNGSKGIPSQKKYDPSLIDKKTREFLNEVYDAFGQFSAVRLMELAHSDKCWIDAGIGNEIKHQAMASCLKQYLKNG
jgi:uncharacterized phage-associated protein